MKDIDKLQKRNRTYRDLTERLGSTGLAVSGLIGLLFPWSVGLANRRADIH